MVKLLTLVPPIHHNISNTRGVLYAPNDLYDQIICLCIRYIKNMAQPRVISAAWKKISGGEPLFKDVDDPSLLEIHANGFAMQYSIQSTCVSRVLVSPYPWSIIHMSITTLDLKYHPQYPCWYSPQGWLTTWLHLILVRPSISNMNLLSFAQGCDPTGGGIQLIGLVEDIFQHSYVTVLNQYGRFPPTGCFKRENRSWPEMI